MWSNDIGGGAREDPMRHPTHHSRFEYSPHRIDGALHSPVAQKASHPSPASSTANDNLKTSLHTQTRPSTSTDQFTDTHTHKSNAIKSPRRLSTKRTRYPYPNTTSSTVSGSPLIPPNGVILILSNTTDISYTLHKLSNTTGVSHFRRLQIPQTQPSHTFKADLHYHS